MALYELIEQPDLDEPVLVLALEGWIDAGPGRRRRGRRARRRSSTRSRWPGSRPTTCSTTGPAARSCTWSTACCGA